MNRSPARGWCSRIWETSITTVAIPMTKVGRRVVRSGLGEC
jgi:hypothetical protein